MKKIVRLTFYKKHFFAIFCLKGETDNTKSSPNWAENFIRGVFRGVEFKSEVRFLKFSPEVGEIGPPTAKTVFFLNCLYFNENRLRGSFWGVEHESDVRFLKFSLKVGEIGPPTSKTDFFKFIIFVEI